MTRVSIVLPTHNRAHCLKKAVRSVVIQDFEDWELIIVDDGSTDDTPALLDGFHRLLGTRLRSVSTSNGGASAARNRGIEMACGEYIAFLDSDDIWFPHKLGLQVHMLDTNRHCGFSFTDFSELNDAGNVTTEWHAISERLVGNVYPALLEIQHNQITTPSMMVRRQLLADVGGFDRTMRICEDIDLWRRLARRAHCLPLRLPLIGVHIRRGPSFPYREHVRGRHVLYQKAMREDDALPDEFCRWLYREMFTLYKGEAIRRDDSHRIDLFNQVLLLLEARHRSEIRQFGPDVDALISKL